MKRKDLSSLIVLIIAILLIFIQIFSSENASIFFNLPSFMLVFGCTILVSSASFGFTKILCASKIILKSLVYAEESLKLTAKNCIITSELAYKFGSRNLALSEDFLYKDNEFFNKWIGYVNDNHSPSNIEILISEEISSYESNKEEVIQILKKSSELAPAFGLIGTLLGLIQMLSNIEDISNISQGMSVALVTTFYGSILAYMFFMPIANKLEKNLKQDILVLRLMQKTISSIFTRENPRVLETTLNALLPQGEKIIYYKY
jgi:chemotaxis protein MotA